VDPGRIARTLVLSGYLLLALGDLIWFFQSVSDGAHAGIVIYTLSAPIAYGLAAWAWWAWARFVVTVPAQYPILRRAFRVFSLSLATLGVGLFAYSVQLDIDHYKASYIFATVLELVGCAVIAVGFWRLGDFVSGSGPHPAEG